MNPNRSDLLKRKQQRKDTRPSCGPLAAASHNAEQNNGQVNLTRNTIENDYIDGR